MGSEHVVVGHDGTPAARAALTVAADLAGRLGAHLHVVHCVTVDDYGVDPDTEQFETVCARTLADERAAIAAELDGTDVPWTYHEESGDPAARLTRVADDVAAAYLVVGASHPGVLHHLATGSVPRRLLHRQSRPVVVVPDPRQASCQARVMPSG